MKVKFKKLYNDTILPTYANEGDVGMDLYAYIDKDFKKYRTYLDGDKYTICLNNGDSVLVPTGFSMELPVGYEAQIRPRSGLALKHKVTVLNSPGTIDWSFRGQVGVIIINHGDTFWVSSGMRIAQMVVKPVERVEVEEVAELSNTERGQGGFGSTGV